MDDWCVHRPRHMLGNLYCGANIEKSPLLPWNIQLDQYAISFNCKICSIPFSRMFIHEQDHQVRTEGDLGVCHTPAINSVGKSINFSFSVSKFVPFYCREVRLLSHHFLLFWHNCEKVLIAFITKVQGVV